MANRFYPKFYTPQPPYLGARMWDEQRSDVVALQTPPRVNIDDLIRALIQFKSFAYIRLMNLHPKKVYIIPFPPEYYLLMFVIHKGHINPLQHLQIFKWQCGAKEENDAPLLKQFSLF